MHWNLPLALTVGRVAVIPVVLALFYVPLPHARQIAAILFIAASVTDALDGWLARRWGQVSRFGAFLDPVADKLLVAVVLVMLLRDDPGGVMALLVAVIIGREITISALREWMAELGQRTAVAVSLVGKIKTIVQLTAISLLVWREPTFGLPLYEIGYALLFVAAALTLYSGLAYLRAAWPALRAESAPGGPAAGS